MSGATLPFADLALAMRLERAEGFAGAQFAAARSRLFPESGSLFAECAGATLIFDGVDAPTTQTFGLGLFAELTSGALDEIERFFTSRGSAVVHEVSPFAGAAAMQMLCKRGYEPIEISNVLYRLVEATEARTPPNLRVRVIEPGEAELWSDVSARGWTHEHPELEHFVRRTGAALATREQCPCFLAEVDGQPGAAGALVIHQGVALFGGAATVPELRRRGLQTALLEARMRYAFEQGCDLTMMVTEVGSESQRNAERKGFRIAYTRTKWALTSRSLSENSSENVGE